MIPVRWLNLHEDICHPRQHWDTSWLQALFAGRIDGPGREPFCEWEWREECYGEEGSAAVAMIPGRFHTEPADLEQLNELLAQHSAVVAIVHSDEESLFPVGALEHPRLRLWVMTPRPELAYPAGTRFIGEGWSPATPEILAAWGEPERDWDVGFWGQVTHRRREECLAAFEHWSLSRALLYATPGFTQGKPRAEYLGALKHTKVAPCPSGPATQDSFRAFEALEAACVPILDGLRPDGGGRGYWQLLLGDDHPLIVVDDWGYAPTVVHGILDGFDVYQARCQEWWHGYQRRLALQLREDYAELSR